MLRRILVLVLALAGCDQVFDLDRPPPPGLEDYDRCGAFLYDEPLRYASVRAEPPPADPPAPARWSWDDARAACKLRGMDLAVLNDMSEAGKVEADTQWPYWIGERVIGGQATTVDGCPAMDAPILRVPADAMACGLVTGPLEINASSCDGALPPTLDPDIVTNALCETPRPDRADCLGNDPAPVQYVLSDAPMSYSAAKSFCDGHGGHLLVVETYAEWLFVSAQTKATWQHPFWFGSQFRGDTWESVTGCPATYSWANGTPGAPSDGACLAAKVREVTDPEPGLAGTTLDGAQITACDDSATYALCEIN